MLTWISTHALFRSCAHVVLVASLLGLSASNSRAQQSKVASEEDVSVRALPADVIRAIREADKFGDLIAVRENVRFEQPILKADTITFHPGSRLELVAADAPFVAIVAKNIKFASREESGTIVLNTIRLNQAPVPEHPDLGRAADGVKGPKGQDSPRGGANGLDGARGVDAPAARKLPTVYIIAGSVATQPNAPAPEDVVLTIIASGMNGLPGGRGQNGQHGGNGGDGGRGKYVDGRCKDKPGSGSNGGAAGGGGDGGNGGDGTSGAIIHFAGSQAAIDGLFDFSTLVRQPGLGGQPGAHGANGVPGAKGSRGSRPGDCTGGMDGVPGAASTKVPKAGSKGADAETNVPIFQTVLDVSTLYR